MKAALNEILVGRLSQFVTDSLGLRFPPDRWHDLERGVAAACLARGNPDLEGWVNAVLVGEATPDDLQTLANHLTIGETYFFRQKEVFAALAERILPERLRIRRQEGRPVRIWSAGCSTGEEPYSVAMLLQRIAPEVRGWKTIVLATDLNTLSLAKAGRGLFSEWSFRDTPDWVKASFFTRTPAGRYQIDQTTRDMVHFSQLNLVAGRYPSDLGENGGCDVILCRNVLMYFSANWQEKVVQHFARVLAPGGRLIVGPCDLPSSLCERHGLHSESPGVFQKAEGAHKITRPAPAAIAAAVPPIVLPDSSEPTLTPTAPALVFEPASAPPAAPVSPAEPLTPIANDSSEPPAIAGAPDAILARASADRGDLPQALAEIERAISADKTNPAFHFLRACILRELNRPQDAEYALHRVLFLDTHSPLAHFQLGCLAKERGHDADAARHLKLAAKLLGKKNRGDIVPGSDGLLTGRLQAVIAAHLDEPHAA